MRVAEVMQTRFPMIAPDATVSEAATRLAAAAVSWLPVVADGHVLGAVTDRDLIVGCVAARRRPTRTPVAEIMSSVPGMVSSDGEIADAAALMTARSTDWLAVLDGAGMLAGMVGATEITLAGQGWQPKELAA